MATDSTKSNSEIAAAPQATEGSHAVEDPPSVEDSQPTEDTASTEQAESSTSGESQLAASTAKPVAEETTEDRKEEKEKVTAESKQELKEETREGAKEETKTGAKEKDKPKLNAVAELSSLEQQIESLSHKQSVALITFENNLNRARKFIAEGDDKLSILAESLRSQLGAILEKNQAHQESLLAQSKELIVKLEKALEEGQSHDALSTWDRIQGNVTNTTGEIKKTLQALLTPFKAKIAELRDWKIFAATEKKKELIEQMKHVSDSRMNPGDRSKHISKLHRDWKALGRSNQNEELWLAFKEASDKASEPCKEFFKQRKQQMAANLVARQTLCDELEQKFKSIKEESPTLPQLNKLLKLADDTWKQHAPVDHNKIKTLQKRYYDVVNELRKMRKTLVRTSSHTKKELISRASALLENEDRQQAMKEAKQLQQEWKQAGPGAYKEDRQLWEKFRNLCDQIFAVRDKEKTQRQDKSNEAHKAIQTLLRDLEALLAVQDEELRTQRKHYQSLQQSFAAALEQLPGKQRSRFREQFNGLKRKLDTRYQALPDKKSQALLDKVKACSVFLQELESQSLNMPGEDGGEAQQVFDQDRWQVLITDINADHRLRLQERADFLINAEPQSGATENAREAFRQLCIAAEIRANVDSPEEDQAKRMELQLSQLQTGFGKGQSQQEKSAEFIVRCRLDSLCLGPLGEEERNQFQSRLDKSLQRLF